MRVLALGCLVCFALALSGGTSAAQRSARPTVLAFETLSPTSASLVRLDAVTLRRVSHRFQLWHDVGPYVGRSPGGLLAFARVQGAALQLVGQRPFRLRGQIELGSGSIGGILWPAERSLFVLRAAETETELARVDPVARTVGERHAVAGQAIAVATTPGRIAFLLAPAGAVGPLRLGVADSEGSIRTVPLALSGGIPIAFDAQLVLPALAIDPSGTRAIAGFPDGPLAEVDLRTLAVTYRTFGTRTLARSQKGGDTLRASAVWAGGTIALAGSRSVTTIDASAAEDTVGTPTGLVLVNTHNWRATRAEDGISDVIGAAGRVIATGYAWHANSLAGSDSSGAGLSVYDGDGTRVAHLFGSQRLSAEVAGPYAYVNGIAALRTSIVDVAGGAVVRRVALPHRTLIIAPG
jgi:hypothetical protein